jgi:hypothetical protein
MYIKYGVFPGTIVRVFCAGQKVLQYTDKADYMTFTGRLGSAGRRPAGQKFL